MRHFILSVLLFCTTVAFAVSPSGTLPVMYISTKNHSAIDRYNPVEATLYITGHGGYADLGSAANPVPLTIRGRGNWTWSGFDKKPYKIVFAQGNGQKLLGMNKSKHWALLAGADDYLGFLKNTVGFMLSKHIGLPYTPHQVPVELVLNGSYEGLYFVTETIRIDNDRVNIHEQKDGETDPGLITGGWLVEIDNYWSDGNITFNEDNGQYVMVTPKSPEILSSAQRDYITSQLSELNAAIYNRGSQPLQDILDITDAAKFYLVQEIMEDCESYHGSCFLYKDRDSLSTVHTASADRSRLDRDKNSQLSTVKWHFGPVWDFGNAYDRHQERFIYDHPSFSQIWIEQLCNHQLFAERVQQLWYQYRQQGHSKVLQDIDDFVSLISSAAKKDAERWQNANVRTNPDMENKKSEFLSRMNWRLDWLRSVWGEGDSTPVPNAVEEVQSDAPDGSGTAKPRIVIREGKPVIIRDGKTYSLTGAQID